MIFQAVPPFVGAESLYLPACALAGVLLDQALGEARRWHPLVGFGRIAQALEQLFNRRQVADGLWAWMLAVLPAVALAAGVRLYFPLLTDIVLLYFALGARSLRSHAEAIVQPLLAADLPEARRRVGYIVSRQTDRLDATGVARAGVESVLENGNDAIFGTLFWFAVLGGPGVLLFRLANTLDAMWGYRNARFANFGRVAARIDDVLNYLPARLTALTYALLGRLRPALSCWRRQAPAWDSPNAGPVMAAGAGSLGVLLGGPAIYQGQTEMRPLLGEGRPPEAADLQHALRLVRRGLWLWLTVLLLIGLSHA
ncbi:MAG TPA: adenosylcobinamide-phosphate synthase CbiB [Accumulibacter sp.]|jgi:adenosylcobinamide-phosphate synthase|nr:adenosylcobinamide-phosphate synthase CbiB [Accumulibacter sp.]